METRSPLFPRSFEQKTVHILVRWLIIALAFHFLALSGIRPEEFPLAVKIIYAFIVSNLLLMVVPRKLFAPGGFFHGLVALDLGFVAACMYFLREPAAYYHWLYILLLGFLFWRRELRQVLIALVAGLVLAGAANFLLQGTWRIASDSGDFLRMSILFAVAVFYFFVMELLNHNACLFQVVARAKQEWERTADAMSEWILLVDEEGRIQRINRPLAEQLGKNPAQLVGQRWYAVLDGSEKAPAASPLARMFQHRAPVEDRFTHASLLSETQATAIPLFEGPTPAGAIYVLRPAKKS